jgi:hypothetical protein
MTPRPSASRSSAYKVRGRKHADLSWSGAASTNVDIYRDGSKIATVANSGAYTHSTNETGWRFAYLPGVRGRDDHLLERGRRHLLRHHGG